MSVIRWLVKSIARRCRLSRVNRASKAQRSWARLSVTILEDRLAPAILTVNSLADGPISADGSALTLREAIALIDTGGTATDSSGNSLATAKASQISTANPFGLDDVIQFAPGPFGEGRQTIILNAGALPVDRDVTISGPAAGQLAVSGNYQSTVFEVGAGADVRISGLSIEVGTASDGSGGGIVNNGTLTLTDTIISDNTANQGAGGGIVNAGTLTLAGSTVSGNAALNDAGILNAGTLTLNESVVSNNATDGGVNGGIANTGTLALVNSAVSGNMALNNAGIYNSADLSLEDSAVSGNAAVWGNGGIGNYGGALTVADSTISGNSALVAGGIGNYDDGTATLQNSFIAGNSAGNAGGGIFNAATLTLTHSARLGKRGGSTTRRHPQHQTRLTLNESVVSNNATDGGVNGSIANTGTLALVNSAVSGNMALNNAGIYNSADLSLKDSGRTVSGNAAVWGNGGIGNYGSAPGDRRRQHYLRQLGLCRRRHRQL